jgi:anti-anti-sigma factor
VSDLARVRSEQRGHLCVVRIDGEVDISNAPVVAAAIEEAMPHEATELVIDLTGTAYLDSAGVGLLVRLAERLRHRRRMVRLVVPDDSPIRVALELSGVPRLVPVEPRLEDAPTPAARSGSIPGERRRPTPTLPVEWPGSRTGG